MPFNNTCIDVITSNIGINNFKNPDKVIEEFYSIFEEVLSDLKLEKEIELLNRYIGKRHTLENIKMLVEKYKFCVNKVVKENYIMRFIDGSTFLNHYFIKIAFLPDWKKIIEEEKWNDVFSNLENRLNEVSSKNGEGVKKQGNIEVKLMRLEEIDYEFLKESKTVIFGTSTYYANISWQIKKWFDESWGCNLEGKIGAVFATEDYLGGGADTALMTLIGHMMVKGMLVYSGGSALGQPYIHMGIVTIKDGDESQKDRAKIFGERIGKKALDIFGDVFQVSNSNNKFV